LNGALSGVRVLDFSEYIAGPYAGQMLADMGAEVTKVEPPHGDFWRLTNSIAPFESRGFIGVNKGKRSISLDLKRPEAREIVRRAVSRSDVVIANYRPGVAKRLGVDYETLSAVNPRLIYCENTAFGPAGPYSEKAGYDLVSQAMTGILAFESQGREGPPRQIITTAVTDLSSGMLMAFSVASALYQRERTGKGQLIETSLFGAGIAIQYRPMFSIEATDREPREELLAALAQAKQDGRSYDEVVAERRTIVPGTPSSASNPYYRVYKTRDAWMVVACLNNRLRRAAAAVLGVDDPRLASNEYDTRAIDADAATKLNEQIAATFESRPAEQWCALFDAKGVPCGPVRLTAELFADPHVIANDLLVELDHPVVGKVKMANSPVRMSGAETGARTASPALGQHTREFLEEVGYSADEIGRLEEAGVIRSWKGAASPE
jgi:crotonobetainyl-CoA:carnitine CoA-transferase CaiB-like acyl-CoA transferase